MQRKSDGAEDDKGDVFDSIASSWDNIMKDYKFGEDLEDHVVTASVDTTSTPPQDTSRLSVTSMSEDSFELTAADFEVGTIASRLLKDKTSTRHSVSGPQRMDSSPEVSRFRQGDRQLDLESYSLRPPDAGEARGAKSAFHMSTALSSIGADFPPQRSTEPISGRIDPVGYGSAENEDINLFRKLQPFNESDDDLRNATSLNFDGTRNDSDGPPAYEETAEEAIGDGEGDDYADESFGNASNENHDSAMPYTAPEEEAEGRESKSALAKETSKSQSDSALYEERLHRSDEDGVVQQEATVLPESSADASGPADPPMRRSVSFFEDEDVNDDSEPREYAMEQSEPLEALYGATNLSAAVTARLYNVPPSMPSLYDSGKDGVIEYEQWNSSSFMDAIQTDVNSLLETAEQPRSSNRHMTDESDEHIEELRGAGVFAGTFPQSLSYTKPVTITTAPMRQSGARGSMGGVAIAQKQTAVSSIKAKARERAFMQQVKNAQRSVVPARPSSAGASNRYSRSAEELLGRTAVSPSARLTSHRRPPIGSPRFSRDHIERDDVMFNGPLFVEEDTARSISMSKQTRLPMRSKSSTDTHKQKEVHISEDVKPRSISETPRTKQVRLNEYDMPRELDARTGSALSEMAPLAYSMRIAEDVSNQEYATQALAMESLKAKLFDLENSLKVRSSVGSIHDENTGMCVVQPEEPVDGESLADVSSKDAAKLRREISTLEALVAGYQKENEKMFVALKEKSLGDASSKSKYFDEREHLNRELNMYKNAAPLGPNLVRKSADVLRDELEKEALVRNLREKVAEAECGAGVREKELQKTIDKLRSENRQLIIDLNRSTAAAITGDASLKAAVDAECKGYIEEISGLKAKLLWYAENQEMIDKGLEEKEQLQHDLRVCKRELKTLGFDLKTLELHSKAVDKIVAVGSENEVGESIALDGHKKLAGSQAKVIKLSRNPADIKKIKELEALVKDLNQAIIRRHPDSLASLIQANSASDSVQLQHKERDAEVKALRAELAETKEASEKKVRSLRQEHERIKLLFESKADNLTRGEGVTADASRGGRGVRSAVARGAVVRNLPQAQAKVKELEVEVEKIRSFYQKKIIDIQQKHKKALVALRKGEAVADEVDYVIDETESPEQMVVSPEMPLPMPEQIDASIKPIALERTTKDETSDITSPPTVTALPQTVHNAVPHSSSFGITNDLISMHFQQQQQQFNQQQLVISQQQSQIQQLESFVRLNLAQKQEQEIRAPVAAPSPVLTSDYSRGDVELLQERLRAEEGTVLRLQNEVKQLIFKNAQLEGRLEMERSAPKTPQLAQFQLVEHQMEQLESRMVRREKELQAAVEEGKVASKVERARLESLHKQELREKDEQIIQFRLQLEGLIDEFRHLSS